MPLTHLRPDDHDGDALGAVQGNPFLQPTFVSPAPIVAAVGA